MFQRGNNTKQITVKALEELAAKDEALTAKAKEITGEGEELKEKLKAFAASLGYELVPNGPKELSADQLENIEGGHGPEKIMYTYTNCEHEWIFVGKVEGQLWGYITTNISAVNVTKKE